MDTNSKSVRNCSTFRQYSVDFAPVENAEKIDSSWVSGSDAATTDCQLDTDKNRRSHNYCTQSQDNTSESHFETVKTRLAKGLEVLPESWRLVPVDGNKRPYRKGWQTEATIARSELRFMLRFGDRQFSERTQKHYTVKPQGYGIRTGHWSGGLLAVDVDGRSAGELLSQLSGGDLPDTVAWTSGKPGRHQLLFQLSETLQQRLATAGFTHTDIPSLKNESGKNLEQLDFRYDGCQSVLPPSVHPKTGRYTWVRSPENTPVASAPTWLENWLNTHIDCLEEKARKRQQQQQQRQQQQHQARQVGNIGGGGDLIELINETGRRLGSDAFNWPGHDWEWSGSKARGFCPWHESQSGSAGWIDTTGQDGGYRYHCPVCLDAGLSPFAYWHGLRTNLSSARSLKGRDFVKAAKEYLSAHGVAIPDEVQRPKRRQQQQQKRNEKLSTIAQLAGAAEPTGEAIAQAVMDKFFYSRDEAREGFVEPLKLPVDGRSLSVLDADKGLGKTSTGIKSAIEHSLATYTIAPTRNLATAAAAVLQATAHTDSDKSWIDAADAVLCPESLHNTRNMKARQTTVFDEVTASLGRSLLPSLAKRKSNTIAATIKALKASQNIVLSEDRTPKCFVELAKELGRFDSVELHQYRKASAANPIPLTLYSDWQDSGSESETDETDAQKGRGRERKQFYAWFDALISRASQGHKIAVPCGSQASLVEIRRLIRAEQPDLKFLTLDGPGTPQWIKTAAAADINHWIEQHQPDILFYTNTIGSGVSIDIDYFTVAFEYTSPKETSFSQEQRAWRIRRLDGGGKLRERHTYLSNIGGGLPSEPEKVLNPEHHSKIIRHELKALKDSNAVIADEDKDAIAKHLGTWRVIENYAVIFKKDLLLQEWERQGFTVTVNSEYKQAVKAWKGKHLKVRQQIKEQKARILAKANPERKASVDAIANDSASWVHHFVKVKHGQQTIGLQPDLINDPRWQMLWEVQTDSTLNTRSLQIQALLHLEQQHPDLLQMVQDSYQWNIVQRRPIPNLIKIPIKLIRRASLLLTMPSGAVRTLYQATAPNSDIEWSKRDSWLSELKDWCIEHEHQLSAEWGDRTGHGLTFSESTPAIKCWHKIIKLIGVNPKRDRREGRSKVSIYRPQTLADYLKALDKVALEDLDRIETLQRQIDLMTGSFSVLEQIQAKQSEDLLLFEIASNPDSDRWTQLFLSKKDLLGKVVSTMESWRDRGFLIERSPLYAPLINALDRLTAEPAEPQAFNIGDRVVYSDFIDGDRAASVTQIDNGFVQLSDGSYLPINQVEVAAA